LHINASKMLQTYFECANRPLLSNKKQWLISTGMFSERNDVMLDARHAPSPQSIDKKIVMQSRDRSELSGGFRRHFVLYVFVDLLTCLYNLYIVFDLVACL